MDKPLKWQETFLMGKSSGADTIFRRKFMQFDLCAMDVQGKIHLADNPIKRQENVIEQSAKHAKAAKERSFWINYKKKESHC